MNTPTPRTDAQHAQFPMGGFTLDFARQLERELIEARKLAERYRYLSCESQEEADETLLPWENNQQTEP